MTDLISVVDWSRWQFALTAMYHWLFVPLTLGLGVIVAVMETIYLRRDRDPKWLSITKFWMLLFGINFALGVATGIILEFEFGTNWSNYSWFVGDIFGAPLAIEGILAFFMEATFVAVMFFGWKRVSPRFHLAATWLTAIGATLSALWILVANAWMQYPTGMTFNPDLMRNEMTDFWSVAASPVAINKFLHAVMSGWTLGGVFVVGVSSWFLLKSRRKEFAVRSIKVGAWVGLVGIVLTGLTGHGSAVEVSRTQPMKLAAMEGLWQGGADEELVAFAILNPEKRFDNDADPYLFKIGMPGALGWLARGEFGAFVPGIYDIVEGRDIVNGEEVNTVSYADRMERGRASHAALRAYSEAKSSGNTAAADSALTAMRADYPYFGYGFYDSESDFVPPVAVTFYSFHIMVISAGYLIAVLALALLLAYKRPSWLENKWVCLIGILSIAIVWICSQAGWVCAEVGRQPWVIQDLMPTRAAISALSASSVKLTFWLFAAVFTALLAAEISIMLRQISIHSKETDE